MELEIEKQAWALGIALLCGAGVGVAYDLMRPFRHRAGRAVQALLDALFCVLAFAAAFLYGQYTYKGKLGVWEMSGLALGFWAYMRCLSPVFLKIINACLGFLSGLVSRLKSLIKKSRDFLKLCFPKKQ